MAKLYFNYATMNAGKTTMLLQASYNYQERGMRTLLFVAGHYRKDGEGYISSRIGLEEKAEMFRDEDDMFARVADRIGGSPLHCVFVDEAQFLTEAPSLAAGAGGGPAGDSGHVLRAAGRIFRASCSPDRRRCSPYADDLREVRTICRCGRKATMVVRLGEDGKVARQGEQVAIGKDVYVSLCRPHWEEEMGRVAAEDMVGFSR